LNLGVVEVQAEEPKQPELAVQGGTTKFSNLANIPQKLIKI
jgi:hypothetical protein